MKKRVCALLLAMAMLLSILPGIGVIADAASKEEPKRVIGIVFDNSSSMYQGRNVNAWCRATYAMEVFAAMMNEGDQMQVYPMYKITVESGGKEYTMNDPLRINGPGDALTVRGINSPTPGRTPLEAVTAAYNGLKNTTADEKYLIVLTDGEEFYQDDRRLGGGSKQAMEDLLNEYCKDMQVMYLGIGPVAVELEESDTSCQYYDKASDSADTIKKLSAMANIIFGRDELNTSGNQVTFDVSMSKIIVFVQGENVTDVSLEGGTMISSHATHYSEQGTDHPDWVNVHQVDTALQGMLVTYGEYDAGTYTLSYSGDATSVDVYYEPDVDMSIRIVDENGNVVDPNSGLNSGVYHLEYGMVDRDGNPTTSSLLGQTNYQLTYTVNGEEFVVTDTKPGSVELDLHGGDVLDGQFDVTYLSDYSIHKNGEDLGWPNGGFTVNAAPAAAVRTEVTGGSDTYALSELPTQAVYDVKVYYDNELLTGSALDDTELQVELTGGNAEYSVEKTENGYTVTVCYCGDATNTDCGEYELSIAGSCKNRDGEEITGTAVKKEFEIVDNSSTVAAQFQIDTTFYQNNQLDLAEPIELVLSVGGNPLTAEQFAMAEVEIDTAGLACNIQADPSGSRYLITLPTENVENGKYKLTCQAMIPNEIGRLVAAEDAAAIEIQPYPEWMKLLIRILIVLLILALIWAYLNTKILPKHIVVGKYVFNVNGTEIRGTVKCVFTGGKKKRGTLEIGSPKVAAEPGAFCGFKLNLEADSPRRIKSASRSVKVTGVTALNPATTSLSVGPFKMIQDPTTGKLVRSVGKANAPVEFTINNNAKCTVSATYLNVTTGSDDPVFLTVNLKYL